MKPIICIAPAPAVEPMFFNDGWMVNKKYFQGTAKSFPGLRRSFPASDI